MEPTPYFSIAVPRVGEQIDVVGFGEKFDLVGFGKKVIQTVGPFASVKGPFRIGPHDAYEGTTDRGDEVVIYRLQPGERMDPEEEKIFALLTFLR